MGADGTVTYTLAGTGSEAQAVLPVTVRSANYAPVTVRVTLAMTDTASAPQVSQPPAENPATATPVPEYTPTPVQTPAEDNAAAPAATSTPAVTPAPTPSAAPLPAATPAPTAMAARQAALPQTGDDSAPAVWGVLLLVSALDLGALAALRRKQGKR